MDPAVITQIAVGIETFYINAWDKLLVAGGLFLGGLGVLVGIVMPILFGRYQRNILSREREHLEGLVEQKISSATATLQSRLSSALRRADTATGQGFNLQGSMLEQRNDQTGATLSYLYAIRDLADGTDGLNLGRAIANATRTMDGIRATNTDFEEIRQSFESCCAAADEFDKKGSHTDGLGSLRRAYEQTVKRLESPAD